ncbi:hypothetical protein HZ326_21959, partial [Fusarium oxysporum f. sp. albedinis]
MGGAQRPTPRSAARSPEGNPPPPIPVLSCDPVPELEHVSSSPSHRKVAERPLIVPDHSPRWYCRLPRSCDSSDPTDTTMPLNGTSRYAHMRTPAWLNPSPQPPSDAQKERGRPNDALLNDPNSDILIDFNSNQGFYEAAKKKKTKTPSAPPPPPPPPAAPPADDGQKDDNTGGDGGASGGDAAGGAGDGNGDGNSNSPPKPPTTFENINLGDNKPDLGLSPPENKGISSSW